jgi:choline kinase
VSLIAGTCSRLRPLTANCHKVMLDIDGKRLIDYQLEAFRRADIREIIFVVGHQADAIKSQLATAYKDLKITYIDNPHYQTRNIDYSLYLARRAVQESEFIYMEGDLLFHPGILTALIRTDYPNAVVVDPNFKSAQVDTIVFLGENNRAQKLIFKNHGDLKSEIQNCNGPAGELLLLMKFDQEGSNYLFQELKKVDFAGPGRLYDIFDGCLRRLEMKYITVDGLPWIEIDNHEDLLKARESIRHFEIA